MPFARPSLTQLRNTAVQDITTSGVPGLTGLLRTAVLRVLAWCMAGLAYSVYGYADWIARMGVPFTAEDEFLYAWAALIGIYPLPPTAATGQAQFTGEVGRVVPLGTALTRVDGTPYETTGERAIDATGSVTVPITALVDGAFTDSDAGVQISIARPITGINSGGIFVGPATGGSDQETNDALRSRMLAKYAAPAQGGAESDYTQWALEVGGVTRAWAVGNGNGAGTVIVYPMLDIVRASNNGFPVGGNGVAFAEPRSAPRASGDQRLVADHIYPLQPVTAMVWVISPNPYPVVVTLQELVPNTINLQNQIRAALRDMFIHEGTPGGRIFPSQIYDAILAVPGIIHFTMSSLAASIDAPASYLPVLGNLVVMAPLT